MDKSSLGDRIKSYEQTFNFKYPIKLPLILRFDGVHFHSMVKKWNCDKPFDNRLVKAMQETALTLCKSIPGAQLAYVQSDEITILIRDDMKYQTEPVYGKKVNKLMSVLSARAANAFNFSFFKDVSNVPFNHLAEFDCRGFIVPEQDILNSILWRQQDATRNSIQMLGRAHFSHKQLTNKSTNEIQEMLWQEKRINFNNIHTHLKRGACIIKKEKEMPLKKYIDGNLVDTNENVTRSVWITDLNIPIFSKDRSYIEKYSKVSSEKESD